MSSGPVACDSEHAVSRGILQLELARLPGPVRPSQPERLWRGRLWVGLVFSGRGLCRVALETSRAGAVKATGSPPEATPPSDVLWREMTERFGAYQRGEHDAFRNLDVDLSGRTAFQRGVLACVREIRFGQVLTYGEVARRVGRPKGARAVGGALAANPLPLVIPCHRVVRSGGALGGFSAARGPDLKAALLSHEGVVLKGKRYVAFRGRHVHQPVRS